MKNKIKCINCGKSNYIKKGLRKTQNRGKIQKYKCLDCGKYFTNDDGFYRMRNNEKKITSAIDLYFSNLSSRKVRNFFRRHLEHNASHITILSWCRKYVLKVQKYVDTLQPNLSGQFYADETEINRKGKYDCFWACLDWESRYINGTHYSISHGLKDAIIFLKKITKDNKLPKFIQTDSAVFYPKAMKKVFYSSKTAGQGVKDKSPELKIEHKIINTLKTKKYNVRIESFFMKMKDRVDDFRGLKSILSAPILLLGMIIQHNFIEQHTTINDYPCKRAGLNLDLGDDRWLGLIRLASS